LPNYVYNVVYMRGVVRNMEPESSPGPAEEFARKKLLAWLAQHRQQAGKMVVVNVWDADREGAGISGNIVYQLSNQDLDERPFDPDQIYVPYGHYHILSAGYNLFDDPVLGSHGTDYTHGTGYGLIAPGEGPALRIRAGHDGWITLNVVLYDAAPGTDLAEWEAVEEVTIGPAGEVRVAGQMGEVEQHYPDLTGGRAIGPLAVRVSVQGRDAATPTALATNPRRTPVEHHRIQAWPVAALAPRVVLKRDQFSRDWEKTNDTS
jgi:hypothetical protein